MHPESTQRLDSHLQSPNDDDDFAPQGDRVVRVVDETACRSR